MIKPVFHSRFDSEAFDPPVVLSHLLGTSVPQPQFSILYEPPSTPSVSVEPQTQLRGDLHDCRAVVHGEGGGEGLVLQPPPKGEANQLSCGHAYQITHLHFPSGEWPGNKLPVKHWGR